MDRAHAVILTREEVAQWLKVKPRQIERLGIPLIDLGRKTKRYFANDVLVWVQAKRVERGRPPKDGMSVRDRPAVARPWSPP